MSLPAYDTFDRANGAPGANWTGSVGADLTIVSYAIRYTSAGAENSMYWNADLPDEAQYCQVVITILSQYGGPLVRASATDWVVLDAADAQSIWKLERYNGGAYTQIGSSYSTDPVVNDVARVTASGTTFTGIINGTTRITGTSATAPSTGYGGISSWGHTMDNFEVGNLSSEIIGTLDITLETITLVATGTVTDGIPGIRLDTKWLNFWQRGQIWYHFWQDTKAQAQGEITGNLSITLEGINLSASGNISVNGTLSKNLDGVGTSFIGAVLVGSTLSKTLDGIGISATGIVSIASSLTKTLDNLTKTIIGAVDVTGSTSITLADIVTTIISTIEIKSELNKTFDDIVFQANGTVSSIEIQGELSKTFDDIVLQANDTVNISGTFAEILAGISLSGIGVIEIISVYGQILDNVSFAGIGAVEVIGTFIPTLTDVEFQSQATVVTVYPIAANCSTIFENDISMILCQILILGNVGANISFIPPRDKREQILYNQVGNFRRGNPSSISRLSRKLK